MRRPLVLAAFAGLLLLGGCKDSLSDKAFGDKVRKYLLEHPEVLQETIEALEKKQAAAETAAHLQVLKENRRQLEHDPDDFVANPAGKITVVEFFDYNCGYCKSVAPDVLALIARDKDVRLVFKELPVVGGAPSQRAARIALALKAQNGDYLGLHADFIRARPLDNSAIDRIVSARGLDPEALEQSAAGLGVEKHIIDTKTLAQGLGLDGTPMFIVGDTVIEGANFAALTAAIAAAKKT
jgi:protein-disulfide isomerase